MAEKTPLIAGMIILLALVGTTYYISNIEQTYYCEDRNIVSMCFKLSNPTNNISSRCYYNETIPTKYFTCNSGWKNIKNFPEIMNNLTITGNEIIDTSYDKTATSDMSPFIKEGFNPKYGVITISSSKIGKIAEYSLTKNTEYCMMNCEAEGKVILYQDGTLFDDVKFKTLTGLDTSIKSSEYLIFNGYQDNYIDVPDTYKEVCEEVKGNETNGTSKVCRQEVDTYKKENQPIEIWDKYSGEVLKAGDYRWKIKGVKDWYQSVDFIPIVNSKEFSEWAWWIGVAPTAYWKFNEGGTANAADSSGNGLNLTKNGNAAYIASKLNNGTTLDGTEDYFSAADNASWDAGTNNFTLAIWVRAEAATEGSYRMLVSNDNAHPPVGGFNLYLHNTLDILTGSLGGCDNKMVFDGTWHRYVWVRTGTGTNEMKYYIDGVNCKNGTLNTNLNAGENWNVGNSVGGVSADWLGGIDDMQWFNNYAWTTADVTADYNGGDGKEADASSITMTIVNSIPINSANVSTSSITFGCNATGTSANITSIVLNVTGTANWTQTISGLNQGQYNATFVNSTLLNGNYNWSCNAIGGITNATSSTWTFNKQTPFTGKVVTSSGTNIANATVLILYSNGSLVGNTTSNDSGDWSYSIGNLNPINWTVIGYNPFNISQGGNAYPFINA
jgi:hypothetical protein